MARPTVANLSIDLPASVLHDLQTAATAKGATVQEMIGQAVKRLLEAERTRPDLLRIQALLRSAAPRLAERGVIGLWIFGSVARGDAEQTSDVDLMADFEAGKQPSLIGLASLRSELSELLGTPADLVARESLRPAVRETAEREAIQIL